MSAPTMPTTDQSAAATTSPITGSAPVTAPPAYPPAPQNPGFGYGYGYAPTDQPAGAAGAAGFTPAQPGAHLPNPMLPAQPPTRRRTAWLVAGCTLLAVAALQLTRLPEWLAYDEHGLVGNLTGVIALVGIGTALIITGRERRR